MNEYKHYEKKSEREKPRPKEINCSPSMFLATVGISYGFVLQARITDRYSGIKVVHRTLAYIGVSVRISLASITKMTARQRG